MLPQPPTTPRLNQSLRSAQRMRRNLASRMCVHAHRCLPLLSNDTQPQFGNTWSVCSASKYPQFETSDSLPAQLCELSTSSPLFLYPIPRITPSIWRFLGAPASSTSISTTSPAYPTCTIPRCKMETRAESFWGSPSRRFERQRSSRARRPDDSIILSYPRLRPPIPLPLHLQEPCRQGYCSPTRIYRQAQGGQRIISIQYASRRPRISKLSSEQDCGGNRGRAEAGNNTHRRRL
jgi:hypothetical protein